VRRQFLSQNHVSLFGRKYLVLFFIFGLFLCGNIAVAKGQTQEPVLTPAEKAWLAKHPNIRLAVDIDWAPFEFVDDEKKYRGMAADYIRLVEKRLKINLKVDKERPWPKMVEAVKNRELDAFSLVVRTPQRDEFVNFTKPYISFPMVIVTLENEPFIDGMNALRKHSVAVVKSYASHDLLAKIHPELNLNLVKNVQKGLEAVSNGQSYAFIGNLAVASQIIRKSGISNLQISGQTPYRFELSMAVRKDWPELVPILQKALDSVSPEEREEIYNRWITVKFQQEVDYRIILATIGVGLLIISIILIWNRRLKAEIKRRFAVEEMLLSREEDLQQSELHLKEIIWATSVGTWEWDIRTGEMSINERWAEIAGYTPDELAPVKIDTWMNLAESDEKEQFDKSLEKVFSREFERYERESRIYHKNGDWLWVVDRGKVVEWTEEGKPLRMSGTRSDITERKKLESMKNEFVSTVSHELRTPLTSIKGSLGLISDGKLGAMPQKATGMIEIAYRNTDRLINLVNDILDMEKIESGSLEFNFQKLNLTELVADAVETNKGYADEYGVAFVLADLGPKITVEGDANRLVQVIANLLSNAAKFSPKGRDVGISVSRQGQIARVTVSDHGSGIPEQYREQIFGRFTQVDSSDSREKGGTGLGLNISKSIIEKHNGKIDFDSEVDVGSTFFFTLPVSE
jgi:two-component system, NarL family, sensor histidine kinase EvgS